MHQQRPAPTLGNGRLGSSQAILSYRRAQARRIRFPPRRPL